VIRKMDETLQKEMEELANNVRDLVLRQPPVALLGYILAQFHVATMSASADFEERAAPDAEVIKTFQFALEYIHAVWSGNEPVNLAPSSFDENLAIELMALLSQLAEKTMWYCMASSQTETEFHAKSTWVLIRGHRHQVLEEAFFRFVLAPHDSALREAYGIGFEDIAGGIQRVTDAFRTGVSSAAVTLADRMEETYAKAEQTGESIEEVLEKLKADGDKIIPEISGLFEDILFGGVCNLSRHSGLPQPLLEDLCYEPGQNTAFWAEGPFSGTPLRTLPARIKPGIKLNDDYFATDGQFIRDSAYRAIQWGLWKRLPYRDEWLMKQGHIVERAFPDILSGQLGGATLYESVFYRDVNTNGWVETDLLIILEGVLFVVEAKAGVMPMQSPATNFPSHQRVIKDLIVKAYQQCKRFLEYLESASEVPLYKLVDGEYEEIACIRKDSFRLIFPIGLTVEAFTPFSSMAKEDAEIEPILGKYPYVSMSVDDLFVLRRILPTTGELVHYLEVRQQVSGLKGALLFDEVDHLGAYIEKNRFDVDIGDQLAEADQVNWTGFSSVIDRFFEREDWQSAQPPSQPYPPVVNEILRSLDAQRPNNWLEFDGVLRDYGQEGRDNIQRYFDKLVPTLAEHPRRRLLVSSEDGEPLQVWICRKGEQPTTQSVQYQAQVACAVLGVSKIRVLIITYDQQYKIYELSCAKKFAAAIIQNNYASILADAKRQLDKT
jgi:hypothetical protein